MTNSPPDRDDDPLAARLRAALTSEADMVQPSDDGLQNIRAGIDETGRRPWWRHPATPALAAALVLGLMAGGIAVLAGGDKDVTATPAGNGSSTAASGTETSTPSPDESDTSTPTPSTPVAVEGDVYVYYVMDDGQSPRLYREQRPNPGMDPVTAALSTMLTEPAVDPDYTSPWPENTGILDYSVQGDVATVNLSRFVSVGAAAENAAVQQLVYTVTANDKAVKQVRLLVDGKTPPSGHQDWSQPVARAPMADVQGWIWLLTPTQGSTIGSPVSFTGYGTAFEATISWEVRQAGKVVEHGTVQGGANGEFGEFSGTVQLAPGSYEMRAFESSAKDGSPQHVDTKTFTVVPSPT
jgi:hypothetical protein